MHPWRGQTGLLGGVSTRAGCERFVHHAWSLDHLGSVGSSWLSCNRGPWRISPLVPVLYFSVTVSVVLIPLTFPFVSPT